VQAQKSGNPRVTTSRTAKNSNSLSRHKEQIAMFQQAEKPSADLFLAVALAVQQLVKASTRSCNSFSKDSARPYPIVRLRTEGSGLSTQRFRRNIWVLRRSCRPASRKTQDRYYAFTTVAKDRKKRVPNSLIGKGVGSPAWIRTDNPPVNSLETKLITSRRSREKSRRINKL